MPILLLRIARSAAFILLSVSLLLPWFRVPVSIRESLNGPDQVVYSEPATTVVFKIVVLLFLLGACWLRCRRRPAGFTNTLFMVGGCILLAVLGITYPALTMQRCSAVSSHAGWLQAQNYSLILPFGDAYRAQEYAQEPGENLLNVSEVLPHAFEALPIPSEVSSLFDLHLSRLEEILMWQGISPAFCQFIYRGWFCGVFGSLLLAVSFMRMGRREGVGLEKVRSGVPLMVVGCAILLSLLCLLPIVMAGRELTQARKAAALGNYRAALRSLDLAEVWVPVFAYNTDFVYQRGFLERKLGWSSGAAELYSAMREESEGFDARADQHYSEALDHQADGPARDEAYRGILRLALKSYNAGLIERAVARLRQLQAIDPTCVKVNYALQLAYLQTFRRDELEREVARFTALYGCFQSLEKSGLIASAHRRLAESDFDFRKIPEMGEEMRAAIKP
jgi:hypothetical protein